MNNLQKNNKKEPKNEAITDESIKKETRTKRQIIENFLGRRYQTRYNIISGQIEWTLRRENNWVVMDDYWLNSIVRAADFATKVPCGADLIKSILKSDFTPQFNPIQDYFTNLSIPTSLDENIIALAATVKVQNQELFAETLKRWLVATVANAMTREGCQNHTCLVLTGQQGKFKTTWLDNLIPKSIIKYLFTGKIDLNSKDTLILLVENLIINLDDQLRSLNKKDDNTVKTLITQGTVTVRRPYDTFHSNLPRCASFVASINGSDFLTDPTGSRRFLPFEVEDIEIEAATRMDMDRVWAEAFNLYKQGYQYWFSAEEMSEKFGDNEDFQVHTPEYELIIEHFIPCRKDDLQAEHLSNTTIISRLRQHTNQQLRQKQVGEALKKLGFRRISKKINGKPFYSYPVREIAS